jgi:hypothetical protein
MYPFSLDRKEAGFCRVELFDRWNELHACFGALICNYVEFVVGFLHELLLELFCGGLCGGGAEVGAGPWGCVVDG